jgi:PleD family two-component response regulator
MATKRRKSDGRRPVVLTVDDQPDQSRLIALMLRDECEVIEARTSYEALEVLTNQKVDYVLTDTNTKEFNGIELAKVIRSSFGDEHAIVFVSASGDWKPMQDQMAEAGANGIVTKPFRKIDLKIALAATRVEGAAYFARPSLSQKRKQATHKRAFERMIKGLRKKD